MNKKTFTNILQVALWSFEGMEERGMLNILPNLTHNELRLGRLITNKLKGGESDGKN